MSIPSCLRHAFAPAVICLISVAATRQAGAAPDGYLHATAVLQADQSLGTIDPAVYGQFAEHLGRGIYEGIWVGPDSPIPNTHGYRDDVIAALRHIKVPVIRWPGGCFAEDYNWRDGIGPRADRPTRVNTSCGGIEESNSFGTHEYMEFSELIGSKTYVTAAVGAGTPLEMEQWLEYMTSDSHSTLAEERRRNGRQAPFKVDYLGIGNESWGCGGQMTAEQYAAEFRRFVTFARVPPGHALQTVAVGPSDDDYHWTEVMMRDTYAQKWSALYGGLQALSLHYYTLPTTNWQHKGAATGFPESEWIGALSHALRLDDYITRHSAIMDRFDPAKKVALFVDEWGAWYDPEKGSGVDELYQQNSLRDALIAAATFNIFHRHADRVRMANIAQMVNVLQSIILTDRQRMLLTPTYHVFDLFQVFQGATSLPFQMDSPRYAAQGTAIPAISGSAARSADGAVHLSLVNFDPHHAASLRVALAGMAASTVQATLLTGSSMDAHNTFEAPNAVHPIAYSGAALEPHAVTVTLPPMSVIVVELK
jgi:alpha-N-arabinofuranosidase